LKQQADRVSETEQRRESESFSRSSEWNWGHSNKQWVEARAVMNFSQT